MQRRKFLLSTVVAIPAVATAQNLNTSAGRTKRAFVVRAGEDRFHDSTLLNGKNPNYIKVSHKDTEGDLTLFEYTGNDKGGPPLHVHAKQDEIFVIMEGEFLFQVGEEKHSLKTGDTIFLPREVPHTWAQVTDRGRLLFMFQPSGKMEAFFSVLGTLKSEPTPEVGARMFADHDMKVVGPPLQF